MGNPLKDRAPPSELAQSGQVIDLKEDLSSFERLVGIVENDFQTHAEDGVPVDWRQLPVAIRLRFEWADVQRKYPAVEGGASATIPAVCQRCLEPFNLSLDVPLKLLFADNESAASVGEQYEVWELDEAVVSPLDIVEEALIMAMPLAAAHGAATTCGAMGESPGSERRDTVRPFADLKSLLQDGK